MLVKRIDRILQRHLERHRRWSLDGARRVLEELRRRGVEARLVGSLARGTDFHRGSDIDIMVMRCPTDLDSQLEYIVESTLGTDEFSLIRVSSVDDPHWRRELLRDALSLEQLPPVSPLTTFSADVVPAKIRKVAERSPVVLTQGERPHLVLMSMAELIG